MDLAIVERLACPQPHAPSPLIVRADVITNGRLERGLLGCAVCRGEWPVTGGVAQFGERANLAADDADAHTLAALLDLSEPGRLVVTDGLPAAAAQALVREYGALVFVLDAEAQTTWAAAADGAARVPLAPGAARGAVLLRAERDADFVASAARAVAANSRVIGTASLALAGNMRELARDDRLWVAARDEASAPVSLRRGAR